VLKFLIDECLSPDLVTTAIDAGFPEFPCRLAGQGGLAGLGAENFPFGWRLDVCDSQ
jgi:hypothetical protein